MEKITSINNQLIKDIYQLKQKKYRNQTKKFMVEGLHLVEEAYKNKVLKIVLSNDELLLNKFNNVKTVLVNNQIIEKLSNTTTPQNVLGVVDIIENKFELADKYLILDGVNDPGNLGTIIRTSLALGVDHLILSNNTVDIYNDKAIRATQGAIFKANIYYTDLEDIYIKLKQNNIKIITTSLEANKTLNDLEKMDKFAIVVGNEANGISNVSKEYADELIIIPMKNNIESLNVGIASGIILYGVLNK
ncbi:MAG: RNA methyltransferase [Bacilli bacterium]|nr:RNA methyltransferase [Bacilli bacterium]